MERSMHHRRQVAAGAPQRVDARVVPAADAILRRNRARPRARKLVEAVLSLDTCLDPGTQRQVLDWIHDTYVARDGGELSGLMAHCFLGGDFVDHRLDMTLRILEHFTDASPPPPPFHSGRPLARSTAYAFIELYSDGSIIPVRHDGTQAV